MHKNFTLLELLIVIAIVCLLAAIAIPSLMPRPKGMSDLKVQGSVGMSLLSEFTYEGCQYLRFDRGLAHKGNCTNILHRKLEL